MSYHKKLPHKSFHFVMTKIMTYLSVVFSRYFKAKGREFLAAGKMRTE